MSEPAQHHAPGARSDRSMFDRDNVELARRYESVSAERQFRSGKILVEHIAIGPTDRVLDVGCGTGMLAQHIAGIVGTNGHVLGIDPLPLRISLAQQRSATNLRFEVGDAYALEHIADASFDVVCLNAVFHWLPEKPGPLRTFVRILRPGGRLGLSSSLPDLKAPLAEVATEVLSQPHYREHLRSGAQPRPSGHGR